MKQIKSNENMPNNNLNLAVIHSLIRVDIDDVFVPAVLSFQYFLIHQTEVDLAVAGDVHGRCEYVHVSLYWPETLCLCIWNIKIIHLKHKVNSFATLGLDIWVHLKHWVMLRFGWNITFRYRFIWNTGLCLDSVETLGYFSWNVRSIHLEH